MAGEYALRDAMVRAATTLETIRLVCDRTHEENLLADRKGRDAECHYAFAMGAIWSTVTAELERLQAAGLKRTETDEDVDARAQASLASFRKSLRAAGLE